MGNLADVIERCRALTAPGTNTRRPVVVFDLDGTLFDNGPRTRRILAELAERDDDAAFCAAVAALPSGHLPYQLRDTLALCGVHDEMVVARAADFWRERFFTDDYQSYDAPLAGAVKLADTLHRSGATLVYLSGRDAPNMLVGCAAALRNHGFPVGIPRTAIVLKHDFHDDDHAFKREALHFMDDMGTVVATFDNEPANCNLFVAHWPEARHFFLATSHAPNPPVLHASVLTIHDLADLAELAE